MSPKVVVLGGGVAGLSAAHELAERGFAVEVFERNSIPGGKARSVEVPGTGQDGRPGYPGEHGFRFFPRFYKHVTDTMSRIPYGDNKNGVLDNLVDTNRMEMAQFDKPPFVMCAHFPHNLADLILIVQDAYSNVLGVTKADCEFFAERMWQIITSCQQRRDSEYEKIGWWEFIDAENRSTAYQNIFGYGMTRSLVAAKANLASTKTVGDILIQLIFDDLSPGIATDRVLNGPTNDVWIDPWIKYLESKGVKYHLNSRVVEINCEGKQVTGAKIEKDGEHFEVTGDYYVAAVPVERMAQLLEESSALEEADPTLSTITELSENVAWMNGAQFYLKTDQPVCEGHVIYLDTPWALTSISQHQFWPNMDLTKYGNGQVHGILSVDISEWTEPGILYNKPAKECTRDEIKDEVWEQLKRSLNTNGQVVLNDDNLADWNLDSDIVFEPEVANGDLVSDTSDSVSAQTQAVKTTNREPLLVNLINTWHLRPNAHIGITNLFLASDYIQTYTDLATMEGANEAARRATNAIIDASGVNVSPCRLWKLHEPDVLAPLRAYDLARFELGLPWKKPLGEKAIDELGHLIHKL